MGPVATFLGKAKFQDEKLEKIEDDRNKEEGTCAGHPKILKEGNGGIHFEEDSGGG